MKLGLDLSLEDKATELTWQPSDESSCEFWYKFQTGFTLVSGSDISLWNDQTSNNNDAVQGTASHRPSLVNGYEVTFDPSNDENLHLTNQVDIAGDFTIAMALNMTNAGGVLIGDNSITGELVKIYSTNKLSVRIDGATAVQLQLDSGSLLGANNNLILTRSTVDGVANTLRMYWNGVLQADTAVMAGEANYDVLGVRKPDANPYDGIMYEVMLFDSVSDALTTNINLRLGSLPL